MKRILILLTAVLLYGCESVPEKEFVVYDRLAYPGKPDLTSDGLSPIKLIYEAHLLTDGLIDMDKINARIAEANEEGIKAVSTDIESWYWGGKYSNESLKDSLSKVFDAFRSGIEGAAPILETANAEAAEAIFSARA